MAANNTNHTEQRATPDPAPYAWLDDSARMAGPLSPGVTTAIGIVLLVGAVTLLGVSLSKGETAAIVVGGLISLGWGAIGAWAVRMGLARSAWRRRHPGVDPLTTVASPTGGSAYGPATKAAAVWRWALLVICSAFSILLALSVVLQIARPHETTSPAKPVLSIILSLVFMLFFLEVIRYDFRRIRSARSQTSGKS